MIIVQEQAEEKMTGLLDAGNHDGFRCIHIPQESRRVRGSDLPGLAMSLAGAFDGYAFLCEDGDAFIFSHGITYKNFSTFRRQVASSTHTEENIRLFDAKQEASRLITILEEKIADKKRARAALENQSKLEKKNKKREQILNGPFSEKQITTISQRRETRAKTSILIVEDDPFTRKLIGAVTESSFDVIFADDGDTALHKYLSEAPDVVFLDIGLPDIDGLDVLEKMNEFDKDAYVIMLSGNGSHENILQAMRLGAKGFVAKPFTYEKLFQHIKKCKKAQITEP